MSLHPQVLTTMDRNWDGKNLISKLALKETSDILSFPTLAIGSHQVTNSKMVIYLHLTLLGHRERGRLEI